MILQSKWLDQRHMRRRAFAAHSARLHRPSAHPPSASSSPSPSPSASSSPSPSPSASFASGPSPRAPRGPSPDDQRHCEQLLFDFTPRLVHARRAGLSLAHLSQQEAARPGLEAMRSFFDYQLELSQPDASKIDLLKAALMISLDSGSAKQVAERVDGIAAMVQRHLKPGHGPAEVISRINSVLYEFYGFSGARERFYHPDSSSLARLLKYKTGGPTALGILYIAVAERVGLRTAAVSLPSHLLVLPLDLQPPPPSSSTSAPDHHHHHASDEASHAPWRRLYIDPFNGGALLDGHAVARLLHANLRLRPPGHAAAAAAASAAVYGVGGGMAGTGGSVGSVSMQEAWALGALGAWSGGRAAGREKDEEEEEEGGCVEERLAAERAWALDGLQEQRERERGARREGGGAGAGDEEGRDEVAPMLEPPPVADGPEGPWFRPYLEPVGRVEVLLRLLRNLREAYWVPVLRRQVTDESRVAWHCQQSLSVLRLLRLTQPHDAEHVAAEAQCLAALGRRGEAGELLRTYLDAHPEALTAVQALYSLEAEGRALARLAALHKAQRDREAAEATRLRRERERAAGLKGFNGRDPNSVLSDPGFYSRMYGRVWDDNYWFSAMLSYGQAREGEEDEDERKKKAGGGGGGAGGK